MELVAADTAGKGAAGQLFGELVAEKVSEITQGRLTIDYHPNGDLGGDSDLLRQVQCGGIDIVVCQTAPVASFLPEMAVFDLPVAFSQYDGNTIDQVLNNEDSEFFIQLSQAYEAKDLHRLYFLQNRTYRITTFKRPLYTLEDYKNLQIRTMENNSRILYANQIAISRERHDNLPEEYQQALEQAVSQAIAEIRPQLTKLDEDNKQIMIDSGMEMIEYGSDFFEEILSMDSVKALYEKINTDVNGLGTTLQNALAEASAQ